MAQKQLPTQGRHKSSLSATHPNAVLLKHGRINNICLLEEEKKTKGRADKCTDAMQGQTDFSTQSGTAARRMQSESCT